MVVLAIDPGREKCGLAVLRENGEVLCQEVIDTATFLSVIAAWREKFSVTDFIIGNGTSSKERVEELKKYQSREKNLTLHIVDEYKTTEAARVRYWQEKPPHGWRRLLPTSFQVPPVPVDDYVAVLLAEKFLKK